MSYPASTYRQLSVESATPLGLVVMLYDGAIAAMQRAATAIEAHDIQTKCTQMNRALAIIAQLEGTLNFELGGEVAQTLKTLYVHARTQALKANIDDSPEILRALIENLSVVREAWYKADHQAPPSPKTATGEANAGAPALATPDSDAASYVFSPAVPASETTVDAPPPVAAVGESLPYTPRPATSARGRSPYGPSADPQRGSWRVAA